MKKETRKKYLKALSSIALPVALLVIVGSSSTELFKGYTVVRNPILDSNFYDSYQIPSTDDSRTINANPRTSTQIDTSDLNPNLNIRTSAPNLRINSGQTIPQARIDFNTNPSGTPIDPAVLDAIYNGVDVRLPASSETRSPLDGSIVLRTPANNSTNIALRPSFAWNRITDGELILQISKTTDFRNPIHVSPQFSNNNISRTINFDLEENTTYYWRIFTVRTAGNQYSNFNKFTTGSDTTVNPPAVPNPPVNPPVDPTPTPTPTPVTPPVTTGAETVVYFNASSSQITEGNTTASIQVSLTRPADTNLEVFFTPKLSSTATSRSDYELPAINSVSFARGEISKNVSIEIKEDSLAEEDETLILKLSTFGLPSNYRTEESRSEHTLTIRDDDGGVRRGVRIGGLVSCEKYFIDVDRFDSLCRPLAELREQGIFMGQDTPRGQVANLDSKLRRSEYFKLASRLYGKTSRSYLDFDDLLRFKDVTPSIIRDRSNEWWMSAVLDLDGIVRGYGDGTLRPERITNEAEIAKVALEAVFSNFENNDSRDPWYSDTEDFMADYGFYIDPKRDAVRGNAVELIYVILQMENDRNYYRNLF